MGAGEGEAGEGREKRLAQEETRISPQLTCMASHAVSLKRFCPHTAENGSDAKSWQKCLNSYLFLCAQSHVFQNTRSKKTFRHTPYDSHQPPPSSNMKDPLCPIFPLLAYCSTHGTKEKKLSQAKLPALPSPQQLRNRKACQKSQLLSAYSCSSHFSVDFDKGS